MIPEEYMFVDPGTFVFILFMASSDYNPNKSTTSLLSFRVTA